jgi:xylan 1,4-beta-xylosidase
VIDYEVAGYNHNMADGFLSLRPAIYASGEGSARFRSLSYKARG